MEYLFICYPKCSTCKKAKKWLSDNQISFQERHIVEKCPSREELAGWQKRSGLPLKKFFNTSGLVYKELQLKDKLAEMSEDEQLKLLSENGMLLKRPIVVGDSIVLVGFQQEKWQDLKQDSSDREGKNRES